MLFLSGRVAATANSSGSFSTLVNTLFSVVKEFSLLPPLSKLSMIAISAASSATVVSERLSPLVLLIFTFGGAGDRNSGS
jgi:hypothetical protein